MIRTYTELIKLPTFKERYEYLKLNGNLGEQTFGYDRYLNQVFYRSARWKSIRNQIIIRDNGCDLGIDGFEIYGKVLIHHMNPITLSDITEESSYLVNPDFLICVSMETHNAIHYGNDIRLPSIPEDRKPNDTCPWR